MSGPGFFKLATRLGLHRGGYLNNRSNNKLYWVRERDRVYAQWAGGPRRPQRRRRRPDL